ncbi:MAG TPA: hypothetical protein VHQ47_01120 [Phycisphaerae bacterium]|nr:hypothetical protein [Phycisphaerae bacterium]
MTTETPTPEFLPGVPDPRAQVSLPATLLMVVGGCNIASCVYWLLRALIGFGVSSTMGGAMVGGVWCFLWMALAIIIGAINIFGGIKMKSLQNYNAALAGAVAAILPCTCCCIAGLAVGIWSLVVLMKPEVKAAFR